MGRKSLLAQVVTASARSTPAFASPPNGASRGWVAQILAALARDTPAFGGSLRLRDANDKRVTPAAARRVPPPDSGPDVPPTRVAPPTSERSMEVANPPAEDGSATAPVAVRTATGTIAGPPASRYPTGRDVSDSPPEDPNVPSPVTFGRIKSALDALDVRFVEDVDGSLLSLWERHAVLTTLEGPHDEILVLRGRPHATMPPDWAGRAHRALNEWNHTRRFAKAYVGDPLERGTLPIYAEMQFPLSAGATDALLTELLDTGMRVLASFVDWLYDEGALL